MRQAAVDAHRVSQRTGARALPGSQPNPRSAAVHSPSPCPPVTTSVEELPEQQGPAPRGDPRVRVRARRSTPRSASSPARSRSPASGPARRPASCSRPASAPTWPASRRSRTRCPATTPTRSSRGARHDRRRPRSTSPRVRTSGDVEFDAVVEVRPVVELQRLRRACGSRSRRRRSPTRSSTRRSTPCATGSPTSRSRPRR